MTDQEVNGVVQDVTASTSYRRETVAEILRRSLSMCASGPSGGQDTRSHSYARCWVGRADGWMPCTSKSSGGSLRCCQTLTSSHGQP